MKIVVTGAAGFIGSHLAEALADLGHEVVGIDCLTDYYAPALKRLNAADITAKGVELLELDLAEADLSTAVQDADFVYHLAGQPGISATTPYEIYVRNNLHATHRLLEACVRVSSLRCFVNIATSSVYGKYATDGEETPPKPTSYYGVTKLAAEQLVLARQREEGFPACSLRIFSVIGPRERPEKLYPLLMRSILTDTPFPLFAGSLEHTRSYTYVGDIVAAFLAVLAQPEKAIGEIFNIGSTKMITTGEGIAIVENILGKKARFDIQPRRPGDQLQTQANIEKARRILGYEPQTPLEDGLAVEAAWYLERIHGQAL